MKKLNELVKASIIYVFPIFALILSLYAKETSLAAKNALYLCLDVVIPSLFPFFVLSRLTVPYLSAFSCPGILRKLAEKFFRLPYYTLITIILGYLSGYPTGAKLAKDMFDEGLLDSQKASKVIAVANNCSPLFIIGTVGAVLFKSVKIGFFLLLIHWTAGLIAAFITGRLFKEKPQRALDFKPANATKKPSVPTRFSALVPFAVEEAAILCIKVTGYIVLFAVLSELLSRLGFFTFIGSFAGLFVSRAASQGSFTEVISSVMRGIMEIASGSSAINAVQDATLTVKLAAISLICGFAGFSVHTQVMGIMKGTGAKYRVFFTGKLLHGLLAFVLTLVLISLVPMAVQTSTLAVTAWHNLSGVRVITIAVLILALGIAPYREDRKVPKKRMVGALKRRKA
ncbi:MAG: hypothetical protein N2376_13315 [Clostridia bacterium]|nr:hypothetical protein [Clostridia bacterium]